MKKNTAVLIALLASFIAITASIVLNNNKTETKDVPQGTVTYITSQNVNGGVFALIMEAHNSPLNEIAKKLSEIYNVDIFLEPSVTTEPVKTKLGATSLNLLLDQLLPPLNLTYYKIYNDVFIIPQSIADSLPKMEISIPQSTLNDETQTKISQLAPESTIQIENNSVKIKCSPMNFSLIQDLVN